MSIAAGITIRRAGADDFPALRSILHETYATVWLPQMTAEAAQAWREADRPGAYVAARGPEFRVAELDGRVAGFVDWDGDFVNALHVLPRHARLGVGSRLMDQAEADIARAGFAQARLETDTFNTASRAFYARRGYVEADRYPDTEWNSGFVTLLLVKALT